MTLPKTINVTKESGDLITYNENKVREVLVRVGASEQEQQVVLDFVSKKLYDGIKTSEIYHHVFQKLNSIEPKLASRYSLKRAIAELGPTGYPFEKFIAGILKEFGYDSETNLIMRGRCVTHEVDILVKKDNQFGIIEAKFHKNLGFKTGIQTALYVYARVLDIKSQLKNGGTATGWLVTNAKFSGDCINYSECNNLKLIGWDYPKHISLRTLIDKSGLQPITTIQSLNNVSKVNLLNNNIVFCKDIANAKESYLENFVTGMDIPLLIKNAKEICNNHVHN